MLDLTAVVLGSSLPLFARPITVMPRTSQPGEPPYAARAVWRSRPMDVVDGDGSLVVTQVQTLLIRLSEFPVPPRQRDEITVDGATYAISDPPRLDGQGGAHLTLKALGAPTL